MASDNVTEMAESMVRAVALRKGFGAVEAVRGIDVEVRRGEVFGVLGPNGAGKSSTMRMIATTSPISGGSLQVLGLDPVTHGPQIRARLGVCPQDDTLDGELSVRENLTVYGRYFGLSRARVRERADELLDFAQLADRATARVAELSGGMRRRLTVARSLVNGPDLLLLDEPTTGLDPQARHALWDQLYRLKHAGVTQVLTTHYMDEAEQLCDRLVVMNAGRIVAQGSPAELISTYCPREVAELRFGVVDHAQIAAGDAVQSLPASLVRRVEVLPDRLLLYADDGEAVLSAAHHAGLVPHAALVRRASLEDVFLHLTGRTLVD